MTEEQTLVVSSGHPVGLFPSHRNAPRVISTNGLMVGMFDTPDIFSRAAAMGVANYGQMTAGGWMYIGPQGIVHGTYITLLNAGRVYLGIPEDQNLKGILYISSGLGGMSGAQPKAVEIAGGIGIIAEVDYSRIKTRSEQGWVSKISKDLDVDKFAEVLTVDDGGETVRMWMKANDAVVNEFLLIVGGDDNVLIYITGDFNLNDLEGLAESFDKDIDIDL